MSKEAVRASAFEMLGSLWVSQRMLFGMKNGPPVLKRDAVEMLGDLRDGVAKAYFDDIIGKAAKRDYDTLRNVWRALLQTMRDHLTELHSFLGRDARTLPEICFGETMGKRIFAEKAGRKLTQNPLLFYTPQSQIKLCEEIETEEELGEGERLEIGEDEDDQEEKKKAYWGPLLPAVLWAYRCTPHIKTGMLPAMLAFGTELRMPFDDAG